MSAPLAARAISVRPRGFSAATIGVAFIDVPSAGTSGSAQGSDVCHAGQPMLRWPTGEYPARQLQQRERQLAGDGDHARDLAMRPHSLAGCSRDDFNELTAVVDRGRPSIRAMQFPTAYATSDLARLVVSARHGLLAEIVNSLMQGAQFIAVTGAPRVRKTFMAAAIHEELVRRGLRVLRVARGRNRSIRLSTIIAQLHDKPETNVGADDIEWLFDVFTERRVPDERLAVIIDDAELLHSDVLRYLRLLSSLAMERMPQFVFVGAPSFWDTGDQPARADFNDLITARWQLEPLGMDVTRTLAERLVSAPSHTNGLVFDEGALDAVAQRSDGQIGRLVALLAEVVAISGEWHQSDVTAAVIDAAAGRLGGWVAARLGEADHRVAQLEGEAEVTKQGSMLANAASEPQAAKVSIRTPCGSGAAVNRPRRVISISLLAGAAVVVGAIVAATFWWEPLGADHMWAQARTALGH
jgi:type II secretory pathway predicted ATPase ExeA